MANVTLTTASNAGFIPQTWAMRALSVLRNNIVLANLVTRDSDIEPGWQGQQLNIPYPGTFTASKKAANSSASVSVPSGGTSIPVTLNNFAYVDFIVEDAARAQASSELLDRYVVPAAIALAEQVESDLWNQVRADVYTTTYQGTAGSAVSSATLRSTVAQMTNNKLPQANRKLVITPTDYIGLLADSTLANFFNFSRPAEVENGFVASLYGLQVYQSQMVPSGYNYTVVGASATGNFTMSFGGQTTSGIAPANLTAATLQTALVGLSSIGTGNATVTGSAWSAGGTGTFHVWISNQLAASTLTNGAPATSGTVTTTAFNPNFAFNPEAMILASRPFRDPPKNSGAQVTTVQDPVSGLFLRLMYWYDMANRGTRVAMDILYGVASLRSAAGIIVKS